MNNNYRVAKQQSKIEFVLSPGSNLLDFFLKQITNTLLMMCIDDVAINTDHVQGDDKSLTYFDMHLAQDKTEVLVCATLKIGKHNKKCLTISSMAFAKTTV